MSQRFPSTFVTVHLTHLTRSLHPDPRDSVFPRCKSTAQASPGLDLPADSVQAARALAAQWRAPSR
jgi:hypothetical protein